MPGETLTSRPNLAPVGGSIPTSASAVGEMSSGATARRRPETEPSYYDISFLKAPVWKWEIAAYFFLGGVSGGAYVLARMADRFGGPEFRDVARLGTYIAAAAALPCAPLLIHDLGDPKRFHHMLRMWKPASPMNLGTWVLTGTSGALALSVAREWLRDHPGQARRNAALRLVRNTTQNPVVLALHDLAGVPLALFLVGYTGVLLSCTATPMWSLNPWIGPLFSASAVSTGASAVGLALALTGKGDTPAAHALEKIDTAAHVVEAASLGGYLKRAGPLAGPLTRGTMRKHLLGAAGGLAAAEVLKRIPARGRAGKVLKVAAAVAGLAAGFSLRWAFVYGGHESANDPGAARRGSRAPRTAELSGGARAEAGARKPESPPAEIRTTKPESRNQ